MPPTNRIDMEAVAAQAPVPWSVIGTGGTHVMANGAYATTFGRSIDELQSLNLRELIHADDRAVAGRNLERLVGGEIDRIDADQRCTRPDGTIFVGHLRASLLRDADGEAVAIVLVVEDVTDQRVTAARLASSEDRLSKMLTNISDTVTLVDAGGRVTATTGHHKEILGYSPDFWRTASIFDLVHPADAASAEQLATTVLARPSVELGAELRVRHASGRYETVEVTAVNLLDDPSVASVVITSRNISERKEAERQLAAMRDRALALADQRADFVANVSHELRTPLHAVLGLTELLSERMRGTEEAALLAGVRREAERLRTTVDDLLDYSRVEAEGITLHLGPVDLPALVSRVLHRAQATEYGTNLVMDATMGDDLPALIQGDEHRLEQVLTNLVSNATKFTPEGGVEIQVVVPAPGRIAIEVRDTGPGIPPAYRELVFKPFVQVPGITSAVGGTGLGLALVRGLVELMGGSISLECPPAGGSVFRVEVPAREINITTSVLPSTTAADPDRRASVLVVEDNAVNQELVRQQLARLGHDAVIVSLASEALEILARPDHGHDIVLMDWQLPGIDGVEATRRLRTMERDLGTHVPVVAMTASALPEDRAACRAAGMDDFLPKPVSLRDLKVMIERWVPATADEHDPASKAIDDLAALDVTALEALVADLDDRSVVTSLVTRYLIELDERENTLRDAASRRELEVIKRVSHTLRSTSEMVGVLELRDVCRELETATPSSDLDETLARFSTAASRARSSLRGWMSDAGTGRP